MNSSVRSIAAAKKECRETDIVRPFENGSVRPYSPNALPYRHYVAIVNVMIKSRRQELSEEFTRQWHRSRDWLLPFMQNNQPKLLTKDKLRSAAMGELKVSKSAFDFGWMAAIEDTGRYDWYEPLRKRPRT